MTLKSSISIDSQLSNCHFLSKTLVLSSQGYVANNLKLYKIENYMNLVNCTHQFEEHKKRVLYTAISKSNEFVLSQSADGECKMWNLDNIMRKSQESEILQDMVIR